MINGSNTRTNVDKCCYYVCTCGMTLLFIVSIHKEKRARIKCLRPICNEVFCNFKGSEKNERFNIYEPNQISK